jgi:hypothetical protein
VRIGRCEIRLRGIPEPEETEPASA